METRKSGNTTGDAVHPAHDAANPAPESGMSRDVINIGLQMFRVGIRRYTESEQELLQWLWGYTFDELGNSKTELSRQTGYDFGFIYSVFTGAYDGDLTSFCAAIINLRERAAERMPITETVVTRRIVEAMDYARDNCAMVTIQGPTGRGKTYTAQAWCRANNHGRARYVRVPSGCSRRTLVVMLCSSCGIGVAGVKTNILEQRLFKAFDRRNILVIDEAGHLLPRGGGSSTAAIELLRDLHDICKCSVVMIFTDVYVKELRNGARADFFEQFVGRIKYNLEIPTKIFRSEIEAVVRTFVPEPAAKLVEYAYVCASQRDGKLRTLFEDLRRAAEFAASENRVMGFSDLKTAVDWRKSGTLWPAE